MYICYYAQSLVLVAIREGPFSEFEDNMADRLEKEWERESTDAHQVEKHQLAENEFKGKRSVRVVVDGGWSKRSLGHSYNVDGVKAIFWLSNSGCT